MNNYDKSTKEYEVLMIHYKFDKYRRVLINSPKWVHYKYYKTIDSCLDALKDLRTSIYDGAYYNYPSIEQEKKYFNIKPSINIKRYKFIKRDICIQD